MGDSAEKKAKAANTDKAKKVSFWTGVKAEFGKVVWPDRNATFRQSVAVVAISVVMGAIIALLDYLVQQGVNWLTLL
ncbi:MAG: preprotein translocase subunit SecE [Lachnospiraceae bacterium]|jgi:preprotein translocase subunit SecE|nr:preprotein translocase subunit SecE [Lachnospiraceae bacterium]MCR5427134.1 preprotein translocase subunit SecE [Lachnospiraceae bacterium]